MLFQSNNGQPLLEFILVSQLTYEESHMMI